MASKEAEAVNAALRGFRDMGGNASESPTLEAMREVMAFVNLAATVPAGVTVTETYAGGVRAYWNDPAGGAKDRVLLYLHGGGYGAGSPATHSNLVGHIANATGCRVLSADYRLAPEHPHPAAVEDALAVYRWLLAQGFKPGHIAISGDSAGGGLTLATLLASRDAGLPQPAGAVPLSPWTDMEATGESFVTRAELDFMIGKGPTLETAAAFLGPNGNPQDPLASPLHGDYTGICPLYIQVGGHETLLDDSVRVADRAKAAGVDVTLDVFPEMQHLFQSNAGNVPEATDAIERIGAWLKPRLGLG